MNLEHRIVCLGHDVAYIIPNESGPTSAGVARVASTHVTAAMAILVRRQLLRRPQIELPRRQQRQRLDLLDQLRHPQRRQTLPEKPLAQVGWINRKSRQ